MRCWAWLLIIAAALFPVMWLASRVMRPIAQLLRALSGTVVSYREGDFSLSLVADRDDELGELMTAHNELAGGAAPAARAPGAARAAAGHRDAEFAGGVGVGGCA